MDRTDAVKLVALVASACPAMKLEDTTADAWLMVLHPYELADCVEAARRVFGRERFVAVADIANETRAILAQRGEEHRSRLALTRGPSVPLPPEIRELAHELTTRSDRAPGGSHLAVACPWCGASKGNRCVTPLGNPITLVPAHHGRFQAAGLPEPTPSADRIAEVRGTPDRHAETFRQAEAGQ